MTNVILTVNVSLPGKTEVKWLTANVSLSKRRFFCFPCALFGWYLVKNTFRISRTILRGLLIIKAARQHGKSGQTANVT